MTSIERFNSFYGPAKTVSVLSFITFFVKIFLNLAFIFFLIRLCSSGMKLDPYPFLNHL